jgi:protein ImuB
MFAVIYIPDFALQAVLRHEPELAPRPVALLDGADKQAVVWQLTEAARRAGVTPGLTPTQAMARCGNILIKSRAPAQETAATEALIQTAYNFSPRIEATAAGVCTMDLQGLQVADDPAAAPEWANQIVAALAPLNLTAQIGIAATPNVAEFSARCATPVLVVNQAEEFVAALPVEILAPTPETFGVLRRWGIRTVGAFLALGQARLVERLGLDALTMCQRAAATSVRPLKLITPAETFSESMDFSHEIETLEPLLFVLNRFVGQLAARLDLLGLVVAGLELRLQLASGQLYQRQFEVPAPTSRADTLLRMLQTHLENVRTAAPITALQLTAQPSAARAYQFGLFAAQLRHPTQFHHTLARLSTLCGSENIGTPVGENSWRPDAVRLTTPRFDSAVEQRGASVSFQSTGEQARRAVPLPGLRLRRFRPPFHADVEMANGEPTFIASLPLNSRIERALGPWRSSGHWWEPAQIWNREAWDVQTPDGTLYRIFCERDNWFVEGVYD